MVIVLFLLQACSAHDDLPVFLLLLIRIQFKELVEFVVDTLTVVYIIENFIVVYGCEECLYYLSDSLIVLLIPFNF